MTKLKLPLSFNTIEHFLNHLKDKSSVLGLLQYGARDYKDMRPGGDYDLCVVVGDDQNCGIAGLHFYINGIPVDCMVKTLSEMSRGGGENEFDDVLVGSKIIHDKHGLLEPLLKDQWQRCNFARPAMMPGEIAWERFTLQHVIDKVQHRLESNPLFAHFLLNANMLWLLCTYIRLNQLPIGNYMAALEYMEENDQDLYICFSDFHYTLDLSRKLAVAKMLVNRILESLNGGWGHDEVILHYKDFSKVLSNQEMERALRLIF